MGDKLRGNFWLDGGQLPEPPEFMQRAEQWMALLVKRQRETDLQGIKDLITSLRWIELQANSDPHMMALETAASFMHIVLAELQHDEMQFAEALEDLATAKQILEAKRARTGRPDSFNWCYLLGICGDIKWKAPDKFRDSVLTPEQMAEMCPALEKRIRAYLAKQPDSDSGNRHARIHEMPQWTALHVIQAMLRYLPDKAEDMLSFADELHDGRLTDLELPFYWDMVITREFVAGQLRPLDWENWRAKRIHYAISKLGQGRALKQYAAALERERTYLQQLLRERLELLEA